MEQRMKALELRLAELERLIPDLPTCKRCGFLLMGCEGHKPGDHPWHMQCYRCGSYWSVEEPRWKFVEEERLDFRRKSKKPT